jgi:protease-4
MKSSAWSTAIKKVAYLAFWVVLPLVLGVILALAWVPVPRVGVIRFEDVIWQESSSSLGELLDHAQSDRRIRAVVLEINSPGGEVTATEETYYRLLELRQTKPLVVTVDGLAASGGYYIAAAADYIFAKPASLLGNIGVITFLPSADEWRYTDEDYVSTGPFKFSGGSRGDFVRQIELSKQGFLEAVNAQRGSKLQVDQETLAGGEVFLGVQALRMGLIDELGANSEAVQKAASLAYVAHYRVEDVNRTVYGDLPQGEAGFASGRWMTLLSSHSPAWRQDLYYLYVEPQGRVRP